MDDHSDQPGTKNPQPGTSGGYLDPSFVGYHYLLASNNFSDAVKVATELSEKESKHSGLTDQQQKISDLIREDEERESDSLKSDFDKLNLAFNSVLQHAQGVELDIQSLSSVLVDQHDYLESMPTLKPTSGWYTSGFGVRNSPFTGHSTMHEGLDIANNIGSPILAPAAGIVTYAGARPGYGNLITVDHGYGLQTQYGHISRAYVRVGQKVKRGERIGAVGNVGRSTGPHLHYEVRVNGIPVDPYYYILED
jgi:murein DD-endopeptidase MepM/ murein hydrolase activator NlpD